jgi:hypothetical protein
MKAFLTLGLCLHAPVIVSAAERISLTPNNVPPDSDDHAGTDYVFAGKAALTTREE